MPPRGKIEKSKDFKGAMKRLLSSLSPWKVLLIISIVLAMTSSIISLITPNKLSDLTDYITEGLRPRVSEEKIKDIMSSDKISIEDKQKTMEIMQSLDKNTKDSEMLEAIDKLPKSVYNEIKPKMNLGAIKSIALLLTILYVVSSLFSYIQQIIMANITNSYAKKVRGKISDKINRLPLKYFDKHETGDVLSRVTNDIDTMSMNLNQSFASLITNITLFLGSLVMMFITNPIMALVAIVSSIIGFSFMFLILGKSQKYFTERQKMLGDLNGYVEEMYSGHNVIKSYDATEEVNDNFDKLNNGLFESSRKSQFLSGIMQPLMGFVGNLHLVQLLHL